MSMSNRMRSKQVSKDLEKARKEFDQWATEDLKQALIEAAEDLGIKDLQVDQKENKSKEDGIKNTSDQNITEDYLYP